MHFDDTRFALLGGTTSARNKRAARASIDSYMWVRGQSGICAPAEMCYIGNRIGVSVNCATIAPEGYLKPSHVFRKDECLSGTVSMLASRPHCSGHGALGTTTRKIRRDREMATMAIEGARYSMMLGSTYSGECFVMSNTEPSSFAPLITIEYKEGTEDMDTDTVTRLPTSTKKSATQDIKMHDSSQKPKTFTPKTQGTSSAKGKGKQDVMVAQEEEVEELKKMSLYQEEERLELELERVVEKSIGFEFQESSGGAIGASPTTQ